MPKFSVRYINSSGAVENKVMDAANKTILYDMVRHENGKLVSAEQQSDSAFSVWWHKAASTIGTVGLQEKLIFARNLSAMLTAGLSLSRSIGIMERQTKNDVFKAALQNINDEIGKGSTFAQGLQKYPKIFNELFISMVRAGEEGGNMAATLETLSAQMEKSYMLTKKVKGAMIYPGVIISVMIIIFVIMMIFVVPSLTASFKDLNVALPSSTLLIIAVSDFLKDHTILFVLSVFAFIGSLVFIARTKQGQLFFDWLFPRLPVIGTIIKEMNAARLARTLASLLASGVEVVTALTITKDVLQNVYYKNVIDEAVVLVQKGSPMSEVFMRHEDIYPSLVGEMMSVGEETGTVADMLAKLAVFYEQEVDQKTKDLSTIIEPVLMVIVGVGVGFFAMAMITPAYSLVNNI